MRLQRLSVLAVALFALGSCSKDSTAPNPAVAAIHVTPGTDTIGTLGRTVTFTAQAVDASGSPVTATVIWRSSNPAVVTVDSATGLATAVTNGTAVISAHAGNVAGQATMAVAQVVAHIVISPPTAGFTSVGDTQRLAAVAKDSSNAIVAGVPFLWLSSNSNVATVDTGGLVTSRGSGQAFVTAAGRGVPGFAVLSVNQVAGRLAFSSPPTSTMAGAALNPAIQIEVRDAQGVLVANSRAAVTLTLGTHLAGAALLGSTTVNAVNGIATFSGLTVEKSDSQYTLVASAGGLPADTSVPFTVAPGPVDHVAISVPDSAINGAPMSPLTVSLFDRFGNFAYNATDSITLDADSAQWNGHLVGQLTVVPVGGLATFSAVRYSSPGLFQIRARQKGVVVGSAARIRQHLNFKDITVGLDHSCATTPAAAAVFCWGTGNQGQLGDGTITRDSVPRLVDPSQTMGLVSAGGQMTCGRTPAAVVYCWGQTVFSLDAVPTLSSGVQTFATISAGQVDVCGLTGAGAAYCWGANYYGAFGDGTTSPDSIPHAVLGGHVFSTIATGGGHTCGLVSGAAFCWGYNTSGQLGSNSLDTVIVPTPVVGGLTFTTISTGSATTCGLVNGGAAYCWGGDFAGATGDTLFPQTDTVPGLVQGGLSFSAISAGGPQTCALASGAAYCWGDNFNGELGSAGGTTALPRAVSGGLSFVEIAAGAGFTCALTSAGQVYCWGSNTDGVGGDGTTVSHPVPTAAVQR